MRGESSRSVAHVLPYLGLLLVAGLSSFFVPAGQTLWARALGITGTVNTGEFEPPDDEDGDDESEADDLERTQTPVPEPTSTPTPLDNRSCPPAFWGNPLHLEFWPESLSPDGLASEVFEIGIPDSPTLLEALSLEGDGPDSLIREATAAWLNALSPGIEFELSPEGIVELFQVAYGSGDPDLIAEAAGELHELNDGDCPWLGEGEVDGQTPPDVETPVPTVTPTP